MSVGSEFFWCNDCDESDCAVCSHGFYVDSEEVDPECPCCGTMDVQP
jgi:hypothetical protein